MEYVTRKFENTNAGLSEKDQCTRELTRQGFVIISEQIEKGHIKGHEQCCWALICLPGIFLAGRTPGTILITYGMEVKFCTSCAAPTAASGRYCTACGADVSTSTACDEQSARAIAQRKQQALEKAQQVQQVSCILSDAIKNQSCFDWNSLRQEYDIVYPVPAREFEPCSPPLFIKLGFRFTSLQRLLPFLAAKCDHYLSEEAQREIAARDHERAIKEWQLSRTAFESLQDRIIADKRERYFSCDPSVLDEYWNALLKQSKYPDSFSRNWQLTYDTSDQHLTVCYEVPHIDVLRSLFDTDASSEIGIHPADSAMRSVEGFYADVLIKIALRTIYELFKSDDAKALASIVFNGTVPTVDRSNGKRIAPCVISCGILRQQFTDIDFNEIEPKACFDGLEGRISTNLLNLQPIAV